MRLEARNGAPRAASRSPTRTLQRCARRCAIAARLESTASALKPDNEESFREQRGVKIVIDDQDRWGGAVFGRVRHHDSSPLGPRLGPSRSGVPTPEAISALPRPASICADLCMPQVAAAVAVGHVVRLEPLPAEHAARSGLQLRPPARWAAAHAADRTERDLDDPVPRIAQRQDGRPGVGVKYATVKPFQLVLERLECTLQRRGVVLKSDILYHTASCIARLEPTCEVLGALPAGGEDVRSELNQEEAPLIQFEGGDFRRRADGQLRPEPSIDERWRTACTQVQHDHDAHHPACSLDRVRRRRGFAQGPQSRCSEVYRCSPVRISPRRRPGVIRQRPSRRHLGKRGRRDARSERRSPMKVQRRDP